MQIRNILLVTSYSFSGFLPFLVNLQLHLFTKHQSEIKITLFNSFTGIAELYGEGQTAGLRIPVSTGEQNHRDLPPSHNVLRLVPQQCQKSCSVRFLVEAC